ncbi:MAG: DUF2167 domain-containing protein [Thermoanaerobaculia bacterium]
MSGKLLPIALAAVLALAVSASAEEGPEIQWTPGPTTAELGDNLARIDVPEGYVFAGGDQTRRFMEMTGNPPSDREVGVIMPAGEGKSWFLLFEYDEAGYVKDDEKDKIDADAILESVRKGTEASNEERKKLGGGEIHVTGWFEKPHYDAKSHNLVWAIEARGAADTDRSVNYDVRLLGRKGYISATLVTDPSSLQADLPHVQTLLSGFSFQQGNRYADWVSGDKVAEYGLTALIAGGAGAAAVKLGLFASLGKLLAKGGKLIVAGVAALGAGIKRMVGGRKKDERSGGDTGTAIAP